MSLRLWNQNSVIGVLKANTQLNTFKQKLTVSEWMEPKSPLSRHKTCVPGKKSSTMNQTQEQSFTEVKKSCLMQKQPKTFVLDLYGNPKTAVTQNTSFLLVNVFM